MKKEYEKYDGALESSCKNGMEAYKEVCDFFTELGFVVAVKDNDKEYSRITIRNDGGFDLWVKVVGVRWVKDEPERTVYSFEYNSVSGGWGFEYFDDLGIDQQIAWGEDFYGYESNWQAIVIGALTERNLL